MFTVLKNLSNLMTIAGDYIFFGYTYNWQVRSLYLLRHNRLSTTSRHIHTHTHTHTGRVRVCDAHRHMQEGALRLL